MVLVCEETQGEVRKGVDNYSVKSEVKMRSRGQFDLEATFYSLKKRESHQESIRLYLDPKKLASKPDISISDIELISVSSDELPVWMKPVVTTSAVVIGRATVPNAQSIS